MFPESWTQFFAGCIFVNFNAFDSIDNLPKNMMSNVVLDHLVLYLIYRKLGEFQKWLVIQPVARKHWINKRPRSRLLSTTNRILEPGIVATNWHERWITEYYAAGVGTPLFRGVVWSTTDTFHIFLTLFHCTSFNEYARLCASFRSSRSTNRVCFSIAITKPVPKQSDNFSNSLLVKWMSHFFQVIQTSGHFERFRSRKGPDCHALSCKSDPGAKHSVFIPNWPKAIGISSVDLLDDAIGGWINQTSPKGVDFHPTINSGCVWLIRCK